MPVAPSRDTAGRGAHVSLHDEEFVKLKIDPCGEEGEYHTVVTDGPLFSRPVMLRFGLAQANAGYIFSEATLA